MLSKRLAAVETNRCVACGVCENTCPLGAIKVHRGCYAKVEKSGGMIIFGYGQSFILPWASLISCLHG